MIEIDISKEIVDIALLKDKEMGQLRNSITCGVGNVAGFIGEQVVADYIGGEICNTYDYDLTLGHLKIDVKTKRCTSKPKSYYDCSVAKFNTKQKCDAYYFVRVLWHKDRPMEWTKAWILGWKIKSDYFAQARELHKGEIDPSNNFTVKADCYNLRIDQLNKLEGQSYD